VPSRWPSGAPAPTAPLAGPFETATLQVKSTPLPSPGAYHGSRQARDPSRGARPRPPGRTARRQRPRRARGNPGSEATTGPAHNPGSGQTPCTAERPGRVSTGPRTAADAPRPGFGRIPDSGGRVPAGSRGAGTGTCGNRC
jgi:hypothetical protein